MNKIKIYGIKNCNSMKKAKNWLDDHGRDYEFHDYKKQGADPAVLIQAVQEHGWETVINRKGTTWRQLDEKIRTLMTETSAIEAALENPSLIKRPLVFYKGKTHVGFDEDKFQSAFLDS